MISLLRKIRSDPVETRIVLGAVALSILFSAIGIGWFLPTTDSRSLITFFFTHDQQGRRLFQNGQYSEAAKLFRDPSWRGAAFYRSGNFKAGGKIYAGLTDAKSAFNYGNALVMQGKYEEAIKQYDRALAQFPDWEAASVNRRIATARAERLKKEGVEMAGGRLEADEFTFDKGKKNGGGNREADGARKMSDAEMRAVWLRRVNTKPADFLKAKFAYQYSQRMKAGK